MKECKYCKSEIDKKAKICPHCRKKQTNSFIKGLSIFIGIILIICGISAITGGNSNTTDEESCYITLEKFNQIENEMTYDEVSNIIGCDGTLSTESGSGDYSIKIYYWYAKNGISNGTFSFTNDRLTAKSQIGLD